MKFTTTLIEGLILVQPDIFKDDRGFFFESYHHKKFSEGGIPAPFVQDNHSRSIKGTLRGMHLQMNRPQGKLVRALSGEIFDVAVDLRKSSPTYKKWLGFSLSDKNFNQLYVPPGFAHGFLTLSDVAEVEYKCTDFYDKSDEAGVLWNDPDVGIKWPLDRPLLSAKDLALSSFSELAERLSHCDIYRA